jgi:hypothetical protein
MNIVDIHDRDAMEMAVQAVREDAIAVQLPTVFVLLARPTGEGASQLDRSKTRLSGKNYGTAIGSLDLFLAQAHPRHLPQEFSSAQDFARVTGSFIRLRFREADFNSPVIRGGTHQGVLLDGPHHELFRRIEADCIGLPPDAIWGGGNYAAPLCTSCNVSGDADGSIVDMERALAFCHARGVRLLVTCKDKAAQLGSYPILGYERDAVRVHRDGPGLHEFKQRIPARLRTW